MVRTYLCAVAAAAAVTFTALPAAAEKELIGDKLRDYLVGASFACTSMEGGKFTLRFPEGDAKQIVYTGTVTSTGRDFKGAFKFQDDGSVRRASDGAWRKVHVDGATMRMTGNKKNDACIKE